MGKKRRRKKRVKGIVSPKPSPATLNNKKVISKPATHLSLFSKVRALKGKKLTIALLLIIFALGLYLRFVPSLNFGNHLFFDDDSYWHYHLIKQVVDYGNRLDPDPTSWLPEGRPQTHPPLLHYLVAYAYKFASLFNPNMSLFDFAYYFTPILSFIIGIVAAYLLCKELYGSFAGLLGASVYTILPISVGATTMGMVKPNLFATPLCILGLWAFIYSSKRSDKITLIIPGLIFGITSLAWEGVIYFYPPLIIGTWLLALIMKKANKRLHISTLTTVMIFGVIASAWYLPIFLKYGFYAHSNMPETMLETVQWYVKGEAVIVGALQLGHVFLILALVFFPFLILYRRQEDYLAIVWMIWGLITPFLVGFRLLGMITTFGIWIVFVSGFSKLWNSIKQRAPMFKFGENKKRWAIILLILAILISSFTYVYYTQTQSEPFVTSFMVYQDFFSSDRVPKNELVLAWWTEGGPLVGFGAKNLWDLYGEHIPESMKDRDKLVVGIYLSTNETEAWKQCKDLGITYVLALEEYTAPWWFQYFMKARGLDGKPEDYFNMIVVTYTWVGDKFVPIKEYGATDKAKDMLLAKMVFKPDSLTHFELVYSSEDRPWARLYKVNEA